MKIRRRSAAQPARGSVAVEMAILLPIFLLMLAVPFFYARMFWFYSVGEKAAHDATRYLSSATQAEMRTPGGGFNEADVAAIARWIAQEELREVLPFSDGILIGIQCDGDPCGSVVPSTVRTSVQITLHDNILNTLTSTFTGATDVKLKSAVTMRYVGN